MPGRLASDGSAPAQAHRSAAAPAAPLARGGDWGYFPRGTRVSGDQLPLQFDPSGGRGTRLSISSGLQSWAAAFSPGPPYCTSSRAQWLRPRRACARRVGQDDSRRRQRCTCSSALPAPIQYLYCRLSLVSGPMGSSPAQGATTYASKKERQQGQVQLISGAAAGAKRFCTVHLELTGAPEERQPLPLLIFRGKGRISAAERAEYNPNVHVIFQAKSLDGPGCGPRSAPHTTLALEARALWAL